MMAKNHFEQKIEAYDEWKNGLLETIERFNEWMQTTGMDEDNSIALRVYEAAEALKNDRLNLAFVAEFSRGKTELINAIFFSDYKCRLLPSEAGRTTMCPTELFYDHKDDDAYLKLLPIESRLDQRSIQEFKHDAVEWMRIALPVDDPEEMQRILTEIVKTREVTINKATLLGLFSDEMYPHLANADPETTMIEIPAWRHALISFPHPLLKQGLSILDTPGLNALGSEPELTMNMLPAAQAILFILAADTGVTRSDLDIWQQHVNIHKRDQSNGLAVLLNKIDTLWDDLKSPQQIETSIKDQADKTSTLLNIDQAQIFPVSAQKGLLAKINADEQLLQRSQLQQIENHLANNVLPQRESILRGDIVNSIGAIIEEQKQVYSSRLESVNKQVHDLHQVNGQNAEAITQLKKKVYVEQALYKKHKDTFNSSTQLLGRRVSVLKGILNLQKMDELILNTRKSMANSWTTAGMKKAMKVLFSQIHDMTSEASDDADKLHRLVHAVYKKFHQEHGIKCNKPRAFRVKKYLLDMKQLHAEAEEYRKSPMSTMSEQNFVIKRFFIQIVSQARQILFKANEDLDAWANDALRPLTAQIKESKLSIEKRLQSLKKIDESDGSLAARIEELEAEHASIKAQLDEISQIDDRLSAPLPPMQENISA